MIKCQHCGMSNEECTSKCKYCGHKLINKMRYCPDCNETYFHGETYCIICGTRLKKKPTYNDSIPFEKIDKNRKYCPRCGRQVHKLTRTCPICDCIMDYINSDEIIRKKLKDKSNTSDLWYRPKIQVNRVTLSEIADDYCFFEDYDEWGFSDGKFIFISRGVRDIEYDVLDKEDIIKWYNK